MQRIIQINIGGRLIPIEEDAYTILKTYITSLEAQFAGEEGKEEIIQDIENRVSELFAIRLKSGVGAIDTSDVQKVIETLGAAGDVHASTAYQETNAKSGDSATAGGEQRYYYAPQRLFRNPYDKMLGGVCSGLAIYFDIDPAIVRLISLSCFSPSELGFWPTS
jgi:PspC domain